MNPLSKSSHIELNPNCLCKNIGFVKSQIGSDVTLSAVIKGNAYGHGISQFVPMAEQEGINHFSVYGMEEALEFDAVASPDSELIVMGYIDVENLDWVISKGYGFFVYDIFQLERAIEAAKKVGVAASIHLEVETGMNRTGIDESAFAEVVTLLKENQNHLILSGICTHLAGAENFANFPRINNQIARFNAHVDYFEEKNISFQKKHAACSAGMIRFPNAHFDMVRVGIMIYGFWPNRETMIDFFTKNSILDDPITSVLSWKTKIMTVKNVAEGEYIGYGTSYLANRPTTIAVVPIGYAYGYTRALSNQGRVLVHGKRMGVIGTVNMNMMAIDVSELENVQQGDEVVLIGFQGESRITVASFGEMTSLLNYELLARLPQNIPRIIKG